MRQTAKLSRPSVDLDAPDGPQFDTMKFRWKTSFRLVVTPSQVRRLIPGRITSPNAFKSKIADDSRSSGNLRPGQPFEWIDSAVTDTDSHQRCALISAPTILRYPCLIAPHCDRSSHMMDVFDAHGPGVCIRLKRDNAAGVSAHEF